MSKGRRDYRAEYARRITHGAAKGISRSQARGHPKPKELSVLSKRLPRPIEDERLQLAFKVLRQEKSLSAAAKAAKIAPERLRHFATERDIIERQGRRWIVRHQLPRRMLLFSDGRVLQVVVGGDLPDQALGQFRRGSGAASRPTTSSGCGLVSGTLSAPGPSDMIPFTTTEAMFARWAAAHITRSVSWAGRRTPGPRVPDNGVDGGTRAVGVQHELTITVRDVA